MSAIHQKLAARLQEVRQRVGMFVSCPDPLRVQAFLFGFRQAAMACGVSFDKKALRAAWEARGYRDEATGLIPQLERRCLNAAAIIDALIEVEIDELNRQPDPAE
jgi:hypothetical protein